MTPNVGPDWRWLAHYGELPRTFIPEFDSVWHALNAAVEADPTRRWIHYAGRDITFGEAAALAGAIAHGLTRVGLRPGQRVAICLQNIPQWPLTALGVWGAGAVVVSVSPLLRGHEVAKVLTDSAASFLFAETAHFASELRDALAPLELRVVTTSPHLFAGADQDTLPPAYPDVPLTTESASTGQTDWTAVLQDGYEARSGPQAGDLACLIYTSGTTGPAKGAMNAHCNVAAGGQIYREWLGLNETDVIAGFAPVFHVTGLTGHIAASLVARCSLVLDYRFNAAHALQLIEEQRATATVAAMSTLLALSHHPDFARRDLSSLRKVASGGQAVPSAVAESLEAAFGTPLAIAYGMTETTYPSHMTPRGGRSPVDPTTGALSIGIPTSGTLSWIEGEHGALAPTGELGEIVLRGPGIVQGYWRQQQETASAFRGGALHTGDIGYVDERGWFYLVDRLKDLINSSGFKVWPREVEDLLYQHPAVREAAVVGAPDPDRGEVVVGYVCLVAGASVTAADLVEFTRTRLASYKIPRAVHIVEELPKTPTGKILRRELRDAKPGPTNERT